MSFTTYQAYNTWGGVSLYGGATIVSFNRPYITPTGSPLWKGCGDFWEWECNLLRWMEREGYDVSYCGSVDVHATTNLLWNHKAFMSVGHDEYWSYPMRWNVKAARDRGVNLAFLSANTSFWQIRFQPSTLDGAPNRDVVCYKSSADPLYNTPSNYLSTVQYRSYPVLDPESSLLGVYFDFAGVNSDLVVNDPSHWLFAKTGVTPGQRFPGLLGYEVDSTNLYSPPGMQVACSSPYLGFGAPANTATSYSDSASYTAPSGATVFAAGTMQWGWGVDDINTPALHQSCQSPVVQQMTRNLLARMAGQPVPSPNFLYRADKTTLGNWKPAYGIEGFCLPNDSTNLPAYAGLTTAGADVRTSLLSSTDPRSLRRAASTNSYLGAWYSPTNFTMDLNLSDSSNHLVAFYFWDWNQAGRTQLVEVVDAATSNHLDRQIVGGFTNGQWWTWQANGHVLFRVTNISGPDCMVNALAFGGGGAASFVCEDPFTQGNWKAYYGADGVMLAGGAGRSAPYGIISGQGAPTTWPFTPQDPRAYELYGTTNRALVGLGFQSAIDAFNLQITDDAWHQLAVYCVDGDRSGRKETLTLIDAGNNKVLDTRKLSNYGEGKYLVWNIRGSVRLHVQNAGPYTSAVSGIFLGPPNQPPAISLTSPSDQTEFNLPTNIVLNVSATDPDDYVSQVSYFTNGVLLCVVTNAPFSFVWTNALVGLYDLTAVAMDSRRATTSSATTSIYVDPPLNYQLPLAHVDSPGSGPALQAPTNLQMAASVTWTSAPITSVQFLLDGLPYGAPIAAPPYILSTTNLYAGTHSVRALATDSFGVVVTSPGVTVNIVDPPSGTIFRDGDPLASGGWVGRYGSDGYLIINYATNLPSYVAAGPVGNDSQVWAGSTTDPRALQKPNASSRFAGGWCTYTNCLLDVNFVDGNTHRITLYCLDWFNQGAAETVEVQDAASHLTLDSRTVSNFNGGVYLVWDLVGHVQFRFTRASGQLASLSGVFFDPPRTVPQVNLFTPLDGSSVAFPTNLVLSAYALSGLTNLSRVEFRANGTLLGADTTGSPYTYTWINPPPGTYTLTARAVDASGTNSVSSPSIVTVEPTAGNARFFGSDLNHEGNWVGAFGSQGYLVAGDSTNLPPNLLLNNPAPLLTWASFTSDPRAPQRDQGDDRVAATWFGYSNMVVDVKFTDSTWHRVSLYCLNWYNSSGTEAIDVIDNVSGVVLDHQSLPPFNNGVTETWDVKGHVRFLVSRAGSSPAYLSAVFLDPSGVLPPIAITNIVPHSLFVAPATLLVNADAQPDPNNISRVEFYDGPTLLGAVTNGPPYNFIWTNPPAGTRAVVAREVGPAGSRDSDPIFFQVVTTNTMSFTASTLLPDGRLQLSAFCPIGKQLVLLYATNFGPNVTWTPLLTNLSGVNQFSITLDDPIKFPRRFYRITTLP